MEWDISPFGKASSLSGEQFADGETVYCFLVRDETGQLRREDLKDGESNELGEGIKVLGRWQRSFEEKTDKRAEKAQHQQTLEELFFSLFDVEDAMAAEETDALKQIIALMLERKRVLRRVSGAGPNQVAYLHVKSKQEFSVPANELTPQTMMQVQEQLSVLVG